VSQLHAEATNIALNATNKGLESQLSGLQTTMLEENNMAGQELTRLQSALEEKNTKLRSLKGLEEPYAGELPCVRREKDMLASQIALLESANSDMATSVAEAQVSQTNAASVQVQADESQTVNIASRM